MIYNPENPLHKKQAIEKLKYFFSKGKRFELKAKHERRSISQNSYLHLILTWFGIETGYTLDEVKQDVFKKHVNPEIFYEGEKEGFITIQKWRSTSDLQTSELTIAIERFRNFASQELGIYLPEPDDLALINEIENELSKAQNKIYK